MRRTPRLIVALLAVWRAGGAYVPINPEYPDARIRYILKDSGAVAVITEASLSDRLPDDLDLDCIALSDDSFADMSVPVDESPQIDPQQLAYVAYTSGSTGQPKGVMLPQGVVGGFFDSMTKHLDVDADDVWLFFHNYAFDVSVWEIWGALTAGGRLEVVPDAERRDPDAVWTRMIQRDVTVLAQTPSAFASLTSVAARRLGRVADESARQEQTFENEADRSSRVGDRSGNGAPAPAPVPADDPVALRYVVFTGEALRTQHVRAWFDHFGALPAQLVNSLGTTETAVYTSYAEIDDAETESDDGEGTLVGRGLPGEILTVRDSHLRVQPPGVPGEIAIAGCGLARGYRNKPRQTAASFVPNPDAQRPGERLYLSGDRGRHRNSGDVEHMGRFDDQVQIRGYRVEPGEVEAQLAEIEGIEQAAVLAMPSNAATPGGTMQLVAYIVGTADPEAVRAKAAERLWHVMVPTVVESIDAMPLTPNGKLDYRALPSVRPADADEYVAPRTETEEIIASIWSDVLGVDDVGVATDFFRLGGNSITAIQIAGRIEDAFGMSVALSQLLSRTTVEQVAEHVEVQLIGATSDDDLEDLLEAL